MSDETVDNLPREFREMESHIRALPVQSQPEIQEAYSRVLDCVRRRRRILSLVQEALSQLRLDVKYLMFDLDATKRERDDLQTELDKLLKGDGDSFDEN